MLEESGQIMHLERQKIIPVLDAVFWDGTFLPAVTWRVDFYYFDMVAGAWTVEDWKSAATVKLPDYKIKRQALLLKYPHIAYVESGVS
jgi:hypothetical protein